MLSVRDGFPARTVALLLSHTNCDDVLCVDHSRLPNGLLVHHIDLYGTYGHLCYPSYFTWCIECCGLGVELESAKVGSPIFRPAALHMPIKHLVY
jgi:hypothetical protein